jgi:hypothetical protein
MKILVSILKRLSGFSGITFSFAAILIIFGIVKGIPGFDLQIDDEQRIAAIVCGMLLAVFSMIFRLLAGEEKIHKVTNYLNDEELSSTQRAIVKLIRDEYQENGVVSQDFIEREANIWVRSQQKERMEPPEVYFRLEALILYGYIQKSPVGKEKKNAKQQRFAYILSSDYLKREKMEPKIPTTNYDL